MIAIINTAKNPLPTGIHEYRVQINYDLICMFKHRREDGLAACLRRAADAVEKQEKPVSRRVLGT